VGQKKMIQVQLIALCRYIICVISTLYKSMLKCSSLSQRRWYQTFFALFFSRTGLNETGLIRSLWLQIALVWPDSSLISATEAFRPAVRTRASAVIPNLAGKRLIGWRWRAETLHHLSYGHFTHKTWESLKRRQTAAAVQPL